MVELRPLGRTSLEVSALALGTVKFGRNTGVKYPTSFELPTDAQAASLLAYAAELGINLIDTAPAYGTSEVRLGNLLRGQRQRWLLCTKVGETYANEVSSYDFHPDAVRKSVERSLTRLNTDYLDIVLIHSNGDDAGILEGDTLDTLMSLRDAGKIRAVGLSHITVAGGLRAIELGADVLMTTLNFQEREQLPVIEQALQNGCGVLVKKALGSGHQGLESLRYAAQQPGVSSVVVGTLDPQHLQANADAISNEG